MDLFEEVKYAYIYGNRLVRPGDEVKLLPIELRKEGAREKFNSLRERLGGEGPFIISSISKWRYGTITLQLKEPKAGRRGIDASEFM
jgi:hypothetical protein